MHLTPEKAGNQGLGVHWHTPSSQRCLQDAWMLGVLETCPCSARELEGVEILGGFLPPLRQRYGQRDFDLADALDDPEPTKKPSSDIYPKPKPPYRPQPGMSDDSGNIYPKPKPPYRPQPGMSDDSGSIYPRPRPPPRPQPGGSDSGGGYFGNTDRDDGRYPPRPKPPAGGGSYYPSHDGSGNTHDGDGYSTYGNAQGNTVAKIVSPIVSVLVVTLVGAAAGYCQRNRRRNCFRANEPVHV
ncbi:glycoprotein Xg isoform X4 [Ursus maritimus]|uniref:Glycoprotein Xg isoform X4 n=1 Tax=Ursus maritimus TaxID=29073 RepID=A0A8M1G851_URSMA|nr:glycoprotein Xg isoform X4 [Ursus maritimus]